MELTIQSVLLNVTDLQQSIEFYRDVFDFRLQAEGDRVAVIMVDYPQQTRLKILARIEVLEGEPAREWIERVRTPGYKAVIERVFVIHVEAFDWNCPQHITPRYTDEEIQAAVQPLEDRLRTLELENAALRKEAKQRDGTTR